MRSLTVLVSQLMSHGEGQRESRVLADAAAAMRLTHPGDVRQAQSLTGRVDGCTDVLPGRKWNGDTAVRIQVTGLDFTPYLLQTVFESHVKLNWPCDVGLNA